MEPLLHWISEHGFDLIGSAGIVASFGFTAVSFRKDGSSRRVANLLTLATAHRQIWSELYDRPDLGRILKRSPNLIREPVTEEESLFVNFLLQHLNATWQAMNEGEFRTKQGIQRDIREFFLLPIPRAVWEKSKAYHDTEFVRFVDRCRVA